MKQPQQEEKEVKHEDNCTPVFPRAHCPQDYSYANHHSNEEGAAYARW